MDRDALRGEGARGFPKEYWDHNYAEPQTMDGIFNAKVMAAYIKAVFRSEYIPVERLLGVGVGLGHLFQETMSLFGPHESLGLEPSAHAFHQARRRLRAPEGGTLELLPLDLATWCEDEGAWDREPYDLGLCSSVFQYLTDPELEQVIPTLARRCKFLFFSVTTDQELAHQAKHLGLDDHYAFSRTKEEYLEWLGPSFTIVSRRILESKVHFDDRNTSFSDDLFRFPYQ